MSDCLGKLIIGIVGLLLGSAELADGARKRKTLSVAFGLVTALASIALLCVCAYKWLTGEDTANDDDADETEEVSAADAKAEEAAPVQEDAE